MYKFITYKNGVTAVLRAVCKGMFPRLGELVRMQLADVTEEKDDDTHALEAREEREEAPGCMQGGTCATRRGCARRGAHRCGWRVRRRR